MPPSRSLAAVLALAAAVTGAATATAQAPALAPSAAPATAPTAAPAARVDSVFAAFAAPTGPGCAVGVSQGGQPVLARGYGMADLEGDRANGAATIFEAGSVTKQVTAAAVVLLAVDGRLSLDDDARRYLPELPDLGARITIRHLLTHTSGLRDWGAVAALGGWPRGTRAYTNAELLDIVRRQRALNYAPGAHYSYTNTGYSLLPLLVERVSGTPFAEFTRTRLFAPLGMAATQWRDDHTRIVKGRAVAYQPAPGGGFRLDMPFESVVGNGGLLTTVGDLLRWTENLETGAVGGTRFLAEMHRQARLTGGRQIEYAGGLFVTSYRGLPEVSHSGATAGYRAFLARYPRQRLAVAVLCNAAHANATALAHAVADAYLGDAPTAPVTVTQAAAVRGAGDGDAAPAAAPPAGLYRDARTGTPLRLAGTPGRGGVRWVAHGGAWLRLAPDGDTLRAEPMAAAAPSARDLAAYAGRYASDEVGATVEVLADGDTLRLRDPRGRVLPLAPAWRDVFTAPGTTLRFERAAPGGRVTRVVALQDRVWAMPFARVGAERRP